MISAFVANLSDIHIPAEVQELFDKTLTREGDRHMAKKHPGFKAVAKSIQKEGYSKKASGAILAAATRKASPEAKKENPRLKRVKG